MAYAKKQKITLTTPRATFIWPKLSEPDFGSKDYPKPDGEYSVRIQLDTTNEVHAAFLNKLDKLQSEAIGAACEEFAGLKVAKRKELEARNPTGNGLDINPVAKPVYDDETEELTEMVEMKFTMKASGERKKGPKAGTRWNRSPNFFDAKGQPMKNVPDIWGGTVGKISFEVERYGYFIPGTGLTGIRRQLLAVQIIDLVSGGQRDAGAYGFGAEEDGYEHDEDAHAKSPSKSDAADDEFAQDEGFTNEEADDETDGAAF